MFIDKILEKYPYFPNPDAIFKIQNVADYYYEIDPDGNINFVDDVFSHFPPFPNTWFEFKMPPRIRLMGQEKLQLNPSANMPVGAFVRVVKGESLDLLVKKLMLRPPSNFTLPPTAVVTSLFSLIAHKPELIGSRIIFCDNKGAYRGYEISKGLSFAPTSFNNKLLKYISIEGLDYQFPYLWNPILTSLNFLHCKNVVHVENKLEDKLINARQKKNKPYIEKYYTLQIEPMKKILDTEGQARTKGLKYSLHICRGHFKTYDEKALFGKHKGVFWWNVSARGDIVKGVIKKDYEITKVNSNS